MGPPSTIFSLSPRKPFSYIFRRAYCSDLRHAPVIKAEVQFHSCPEEGHLNHSHFLFHLHDPPTSFPLSVWLFNSGRSATCQWIFSSAPLSMSINLILHPFPPPPHFHFLPLSSVSWVNTVGLSGLFDVSEPSHNLHHLPLRSQVIISGPWPPVPRTSEKGRWVRARWERPTQKAKQL